jgi:hypothetical protein
VRTIDVHGAFAQGAVPRTNASPGETNVTEVAANPAGTGPPLGAVAIPVAAAVEAAPLAAAVEAELAPPEPAGPLDDVVGETAEAPPPDPELAAPQAVSATAASRAPDASPARDARNDVFMRSPSVADHSYGYGDVPAGPLVRDI